MTTQASKDITYVLVDGLNIAAGLETLEHKVTAVTVQKQALGETWPTTVDTGTRKGELTVAGWLDSVMMTPASGGKVNTISTTSSIVSAFVNGNTVSERALVFQAANVVGIGIFTA
ncbi:MAG: hypothetical protein M0R37_15320, partial [Bacteroidales bacterium]|nr:hypothetical protein [Bacteroidales bacterium]